MLYPILVAWLYKYLKLQAPFSASARAVLSQVTGVEPTLFLAPPMIDWELLQLRQEVVDRFINRLLISGQPLTNGHHGIRVHGFTDFGRKGNAIYYAKDIKTSVALLTEQINFCKELAKMSGVNDTKYPSLFTIHLGRSDDRDRAGEIRRLVEVFTEVAPIAERERVIVSVENLWDGTQGYSLGSDLEDLSNIFAQVSNPFIGMTFDFAHALIHYDGDYARVTERLTSLGLLPRISYLHITAPGPKYHEKIRSIVDAKKLFSAQVIYYIMFKNPDTQSGFKPFFKTHPEEQGRLLELIRLVTTQSRVASPELACATVELSPHIWGTDSGATTNDTAFTLAALGAVLKK